MKPGETLDRRAARCYHTVKIESLEDRGAVSITTPGIARQLPERKGATAEVEKRCLPSFCWAGG